MKKPWHPMTADEIQQLLVGHTAENLAPPKCSRCGALLTPALLGGRVMYDCQACATPPG